MDGKMNNEMVCGQNKEERSDCDFTCTHNILYIDHQKN